MLPDYINEYLRAYFEMSSEDRRKILDDRYFDTNPLTCPKEYLPYLAIEVGVNIDGLSESDARVVIERAIFINNQHGTVSAVKNIFNVFQTNTVLKEWFEYDGEPYYFKIFVSGVKKEEDWIKGVKLLNFVKNERSKLDSVGIKKDLSLNIYKSNVYKTGQKANIYLKINPEIAPSFINQGGAKRKVLKISINVQIPNVNIANSLNYFGGGVRVAKKNIIGVANG